MPAFFEDYEYFKGTGEKNALGQSLDEFLELYDARKYPTPCVTADAVIYSYKMSSGKPENLRLLMVKRSNHPSIGWWALPGGFADMKENLEVTAKRELEEETGVTGLAMEQIGAFGDVRRDPRARVVTAAYMALVEEGQIHPVAGDDAAQTAWFEITVNEIDRKEENDQVEILYLLTLTNEEIGQKLSAKVRYRRKKAFLIREEKYEMTESDQIACDHAQIIVQSYQMLKERGV